jgi:hypothetical protein
VKLDLLFAQKLGKKAVELLSEGLQEPAFLFIQRNGRFFGLQKHPLNKVHSIEQLHKFVDGSFYSPSQFEATRTAKKYLDCIVKKISHVEYGLDERSI